jgi:hypothetical protein
VELNVSKDGYITATVSVHVAASTRQDVIVALQPEPAIEETVPSCHNAH